MIIDAWKRAHLDKRPNNTREVSRRYSNGRVLEVVFKKGYRKRGICATKSKV